MRWLSDMLWSSRFDRGALIALLVLVGIVIVVQVGMWLDRMNEAVR